MTEVQELQKEIAGYMGKVLRDHFGKGPTNIYVSLHPPFITIYIHNLLAPLEKILLDKKEEKRVLETRDIMMNDLFPTIRPELGSMAGTDVKNLYADWNLEKNTGMIWGTFEKDNSSQLFWPPHIDQSLFEQKINNLSIRGQKEPGEINSYWLNDRTILVERRDILVEIEKSLIESGYKEELRLAKRPLERRLTREEHLEEVLQKPLVEVFTDWDFEKDHGYTVFILEPSK